MQVPGSGSRPNKLPEQFSSFEFLMSPPAPPRVGTVMPWLEALPDEVLGIVLACFGARQMPKALACLARTGPSGTRITVRGFNALDATLRRDVGAFQSSFAVANALRAAGQSRAELLARAARHAAVTGATFDVPIEDWASIRDRLAQSPFRPAFDLMFRLPCCIRSTAYLNSSARRELGRVASVLGLVQDAIALHPDPLTRPEMHLFVRPEEGERLSDLCSLVDAVQKYGKIGVLALEGTLQSILCLRDILSVPKAIAINLLPSAQCWADFSFLLKCLTPNLKFLSLTGSASSSTFPRLFLILSHLRIRYVGSLMSLPNSGPVEFAWPRVRKQPPWLCSQAWTAAGKREVVRLSPASGPRGMWIAPHASGATFANDAAEVEVDLFSNYALNWPGRTQESGQSVREQFVWGHQSKREDDPECLETIVVADASATVNDLCEHAGGLRRFDLISCTSDDELWASLTQLLRSAPQLERLTVFTHAAFSERAWNSMAAFLTIDLPKYRDKLEYVIVTYPPESALYSLNCTFEDQQMTFTMGYWHAYEPDSTSSGSACLKSRGQKELTFTNPQGKPLFVVHSYLPIRETQGS